MADVTRLPLDRGNEEQAASVQRNTAWALVAALGIVSCDADVAVEPETTDVPVRKTQPVFVDGARDSALTFSHVCGGAGDYYFAEIMGSGTALFDYDSDGDLDVYLIQGGSLGSADDLRPGNRLYRNELIPGGTMTFVDVTDEAGVGDTGYGMGAVVGDVDSDGNIDLYVTNLADNVFYRNNGDGTFSNVTDASGAQDSRWSTSGSFFDYDLDGDLDLFVASYVSFSVRNNKRCTGATGRRDYCGPQNYEPLADRLFRNEGDFRFSDVSRESGISGATGSGLGTAAADFNGDGWPDIYVANDQLANRLWINNQDGTFEETGLMSGTAYNADGAAEASMGVTAGDFDGDGDEDLFMTHLAQQTNTLYANDGAGSFIDVTDRAGAGSTSLPFTGFGSAFFDYDNDGLLDLFVANGAVLIENDQVDDDPWPYKQANQLFRNSGGGRFDDVSQVSGGVFDLKAVSRGAAFGDIDNDGDTDIVVTNSNGPARLLINEIGNEKNWLRLRLQGVRSNRDAIGARVALLRDGKPTLWRRVHTDGSYLSASDTRVLFGLGNDNAISGVGLIWPSGKREKWRAITANDEFTIVEGTGDDWNDESAIDAQNAK